MVFHMKTTLNISDTVFLRLKAEAARQGKTLSEIVESAFRAFLRGSGKNNKQKLPSLPSFDGGGVAVDVADRDALYRAMEGR